MPVYPPAFVAPELTTYQTCTIAISERPLVRIVSADSGAQLFYRVSGGTLLRDGRVVIASGGTFAVLLFDEHGQYVRSYGRRGAGPQEFFALNGVWRVNDSTVMVSDPRTSQVTFLSEALEQPRVARLELAAGVRWPAVVGWAGASIVAINGQVFENGQMGVGIVRPPLQFLRFAASGALLDTIAVVPGHQFWVPAEHRRQPTQAVPFGTDALYATRGADVLLLQTDESRIVAASPVAASTRELGARSAARPPPREVATFPASPVSLTRDAVARFKAARHEAALTHRSVAW